MITTPIKISREKLIEILTARIAENEATRLARFQKELKKEITRAEDTVKKATARATALKKIKTPEDDLFTDDYNLRRYREESKDETLPRLLRALELSDDPTITVKSDSDIYHLL